MANRPTPPEPYKTWLDVWCDSDAPWDFLSKDTDDAQRYARAELAELRAELQKATEERDQFKLYAGRKLRECCGIYPPDPADEYLRNARKT